MKGGDVMQTAKLPATGHKVKFSRYFERNRALYLMLIPGLILLVLFRYLPIYGLIAGFEDYSPVKGYFGSPFVGLKHFQRFFNDPFCWRLIRNTFLLGIENVIFAFPAAIIFALMLNELRMKRFKRVVQTISYMPYFLSSVVVVGLMRDMLNVQTGVVNQALIKLGVIDQGISFFTRPEWFRPLYIISALWQGMGYNSIIYLGAMSNINTELYESADMDGASRLQKIWHITLPGIKTTIVILLIMATGGILSNDYQKILLMYSSRIYSTADVISTYIYRQGIEVGGLSGFSYSTAVGLISNVVSLIFLLDTNAVVKRIDESNALL